MSTWIIGFSILSSIVLLITFIREWHIEAQLNRRGVEVQSEVIERGTRRGYHFVIYQFGTVDGNQWYRKHQEVGTLNNVRIHVGHHPPVRYLPDRPSVARLWGNYRDNTGRNQLLGLGVVLFGFALLGAFLR